MSSKSNSLRCFSNPLELMYLYTYANIIYLFLQYIVVALIFIINRISMNLGDK